MINLMGIYHRVSKFLAIHIFGGQECHILFNNASPIPRPSWDLVCSLLVLIFCRLFNFVFS